MKQIYHTCLFLHFPLQLQETSENFGRQILM